MARFSGKDGTLFLTAVETTGITNWKLDKTSDNKAYHANDSGGAKSRVAGVRDSTGSFEQKANDAGNIPVDEGDIVDVELHVDDSTLNYFSGSVIIDKIAVDTDIDDGEILSYIVDFSGNGLLTGNGILAQAAPS